MPLAKLVGLRPGVIADRVGEGLLVLRLAVVGQRKIYVEGKRAGLAIHAPEKRFGLVQLLVGEAGGGGANAGGGLDGLDFQGLAFSRGFGAGGEILADALTVEPAGEAENDFP